jgi:hypothetical protein
MISGTITQAIKSTLSLSDFLRISSDSIPDNECLIKNRGLLFVINLTLFPDIKQLVIPQDYLSGEKVKSPAVQNVKVL